MLACHMLMVSGVALAQDESQNAQEDLIIGPRELREFELPGTSEQPAAQEEPAPVRVEAPPPAPEPTPTAPAASGKAVVPRVTPPSPVTAAEAPPVSDRPAETPTTAPNETPAPDQPLPVEPAVDEAVAPEPVVGAVPTEAPAAADTSALPQTAETPAPVTDGGPSWTHLLAILLLALLGFFGFRALQKRTPPEESLRLAEHPSLIPAEGPAAARPPATRPQPALRPQPGPRPAAPAAAAGAASPPSARPVAGSVPRPQPATAPGMNPAAGPAANPGLARASRPQGAPPPQPTPPPPPAATRQPVPAGTITSNILRRSTARPAAPAAPPPQAPAEPAGTVGIQLRPWLQLEFRPQRAAATETEAAVHYELIVTNTGNVAARNVRVEARMFNAGPDQEREVKSFFAGSIRGQGDGQLLTVPPRGSVRVRNAVAMHKEAVREIAIEGRRLFIPVVAFNVLYAWGEGKAGQTSMSYIVGREAEKPSDRMGAFRLDLGPRVYRSVGQRATREAVLV